MRSTNRIILTLFLSLNAFVGTQAQGATITFDALEAPGVSFQILANPFDTEGFRFTALGGTGGEVPASYRQGSTFYNGSAALIASNSADLEMTKLGGGLFDVFSIDVDGLFGSIRNFEFIGNLSGGGQITQTFLANNTLGNQTVNLAGFQNLTSLILGAVGTVNLANMGSVDNINTSLNAVPVPAAIWLFGTALMGLAGFSKRRKAA